MHLCSTLFYHSHIKKTKQIGTSVSGSLACDILHIFGVIELIELPTVHRLVQILNLVPALLMLVNVNIKSGFDQLISKS